MKSTFVNKKTQNDINKLFKCVAIDQVPIDMADKIVSILEKNKELFCFIPSGYSYNNDDFLISNNMKEASANTNSERSLVEKITNMVDAVLSLFSDKKKFPIKDKSVDESVEKLLGKDYLDYPASSGERKKRKLQKDLAMLNVSGSTKNPNLTLIDRGTGVKNKKIPTTLLHISGDKQNTKGLMGKFGQGSFSAINKCSYQLIVTRHHTKDEAWSFTIVRWNREERQIEHLVLGKVKNLHKKEIRQTRIPTLTLEKVKITGVSGRVKIKDEKKKKQVTKEMDYGTIIALIDFDIKLGNDAHVVSLPKILNDEFNHISVPILVNELRKKDGTGNSFVLWGNRVRQKDAELAGHLDYRIDKKPIVLKDPDTHKYLGKVFLDLIITKPDYSAKKLGTNFGTVSVHGQVHAKLTPGKTFEAIDNKVVDNSLGFVKGSIRYNIDASKLSESLLLECFGSSRENMTDSFSNILLKELQLLILQEPKILDINQKRKEMCQGSKSTGSLLDSLSSKYRDKVNDLKRMLAKVHKIDKKGNLSLKGGLDIKPTKKRVKEEFVGKDVPTFLRLREYETDSKNNKLVKVNLKEPKKRQTLFLVTDGKNELFEKPNNGKITIKLLSKKHEYNDVVLTQEVTPYNGNIKIVIDRQVFQKGDQPKLEVALSLDGKTTLFTETFLVSFFEKEIIANTRNSSNTKKGNRKKILDGEIVSGEKGDYLEQDSEEPNLPEIKTIGKDAVWDDNLDYGGEMFEIEDKITDDNDFLHIVNDSLMYLNMDNHIFKEFAKDWDDTQDKRDYAITVYKVIALVSYFVCKEDVGKTRKEKLEAIIQVGFTLITWEK